MHNLEDFISLLSSPANIVITTHVNPDADALGSSLALSLVLQQQGHRVTVITPNIFPDFLTWMPESEKVVIYENNKEFVHSLLESIEIIFCLDFSDLKRINDLGEHVGKSSAIKILIDHHRDPDDFAKFIKWSNEAGATAELLFDLLSEMKWLNTINSRVANCIYAGIMTDTGGFRHPNTTKHIHEIVAQLIEMGADTANVAKLIYGNKSINRLRLIGFSLLERLVVLPDFKVAYIHLSSTDQRKFNTQQGDTEGLVDYALSIKGINMAAIFKERKDLVKISFRSIGSFSVNDFARNHFNGGGHQNASGGNSEFSLTETIKNFKQLLPKYKNELLNTKADGSI